MNPTESTSVDDVDGALASYLRRREGQRGIDTYGWVVRVLRSSASAAAHVLTASDATAMIIDTDECRVICCLDGSPETCAKLIEYARSDSKTIRLRGLALPGDRVTKNLFEEARLPAQLLIH